MPKTLELAGSGVLRAACELLAETGYGAMSMRKLASRAGVLPGSLYHHISSKQDLLLDVLLDIIDRRLGEWNRVARPADLFTYLRFVLERQRTHPGEELLLRHETRYLDNAQMRCLDQALQRLRAPLSLILENGQLDGTFDIQDLASTCEAIHALLDTADGMRRRAAAIDESGIEAWLTQICLKLLNARKAGHIRAPDEARLARQPHSGNP